jgi:Outer membrane protein beta-barrel domain
MQRSWILVLLLSMLAGSAWAQIPTKGNVFVGYSYDHTSLVTDDTTNLNGWEATLEGKFLPWIGLVVDADGHYGSHDFSGVCNGLSCPNVHADVAAHNVLFGPRVSVSYKRFRPFGEFLFGVGHISRSNGISDSDTSFADGVGGGLDYRIAGPVTLRGQLDWINTRFYGEGQNGVRFSTGIAVHF